MMQEAALFKWMQSVENAGKHTYDAGDGHNDQQAQQEHAAGKLERIDVAPGRKAGAARAEVNNSNAA